MTNDNGRDAGDDGMESLPVDENSPLQPYKVMVSTRFLVMSMTACILGAFAVGQTARFLLLDGRLVEGPAGRSGRGNLPAPIARVGREIPQTIYTAKNFDTARTASSSLLMRRDGDEAPMKVCSDGEQSCRAKAAEVSEEDDEEHLPAGQHLLVDLKGVDASFLNSEERLADAMVEVVNQASLTLLSYHCHALVPSGVSCVGVLLESHVSFHTWPDTGVITLDLFTCGSNPLLPVVPIIERLFGISASFKEQPMVRWAHKLRGFRKDRGPLQMWDLSVGVLSSIEMEYKKEIVSVETKFQRVDIYDAITPRFNSFEKYSKSLAVDGSYYSKNQNLFAPDRSVFLDGILQSRSKEEHAYHESLVHPALFAHPNPTRVAIVGGGEGATLREVLKHNTVKEAIMIEIDEELVFIGRQYLPAWSDCSDLEGSALWCGNDVRAKIYYEDALAWFIDRYHDEANVSDGFLDVIIMDALDPDDDVEFSTALYKNETYIQSLYNALSEDGILVVQVGQSPSLNGPPESFGRFASRGHMVDLLSKVGFKHIQVYGQGHSGYTANWNNMMATKSSKARANWYRNEAEVNVEVVRRTIKTKSGSPIFQYFDGATMQLFQLPSKRFETIFCKAEPRPESCDDLRGYDPLIPNADISHFEVKVSGAGENAGRGLFATRDIPQGAYFSIEAASRSVDFPPNTVRLITEMEALSDELTPVECYMHGYGFQGQHHGDKEIEVDADITTFTNHGCRGQYNTGIDTHDLNEMTADESQMPTSLQIGVSQLAYNPVQDRNLHMLLFKSDTVLRQINAGDEILSNYLGMIGHESDWEYDVLHLRAQCNGEGVGAVTEYETMSNSENAGEM